MVTPKGQLPERDRRTREFTDELDYRPADLTRVLSRAKLLRDPPRLLEIADENGLGERCKQALLQGPLARVRSRSCLRLTLQQRSFWTLQVGVSDTR